MEKKNIPEVLKKMQAELMPFLVGGKNFPNWSLGVGKVIGVAVDRLAIWAMLQNVFATKGIFVLPTEATGRDYVTAKQNR